MKRFFCAVVTVLTLSARLSGAEEARLLPNKDWFIPPNPSTFAEFLASQDLVVQGRIIEATELRRGYANTCEVTGLMPQRVTEVRLRLDEVINGSSADTITNITILDQGFNLQPGQRVLAWGNYTCEDNWRLRGRLRVLTDDGLLVSRPGEPAFTNEHGAQESVSMIMVEQDLANRVRHPSTVFNGTRAIALARLRGSTRWTSAGASYEVDSLGWAMGSGLAVPRTITFPATPGCLPNIFPGDTLLVPIPPGFNGDRLVLSHCPSGLRVKFGFVPSLGVPVNQLERSIETIGFMLHVRPVQRKEE